MGKIITQLLASEKRRQKETVNLIPSENYASSQVRKLVGSVLMNKYSEGYPGKRYYQGNKFIDQLESLAVERAKKLFGTPYANVQPYSGSPANSEVLFALCEPARLAEDGKSRRGDTVMGMDLSSGGHLTHGYPNITFSGKYFHSIQFSIRYNKEQSDTVNKNSHDPLRDTLIDYVRVRHLAEENRPKAIFIGPTAYPLVFSWQKFSEIADSVGAYFVADISHVAGLIAGEVYPSPVPFADIVTTTTHKTLRGPGEQLLWSLIKE